MTDDKEMPSIFERMFGKPISFDSTISCVCSYCGSSAIYRGVPEDINKAAKEFHEVLHKHPESKKNKSG